MLRTNHFKTFLTIFPRDCTSSLPPSEVGEFQFLIVLVNIFYSLFEYSHPEGWEVLALCGFDLYFYDDQYFLCFHRLLVRFYIFS